MNRAWVVGLIYFGLGVFLGGTIILMGVPHSPAALPLIGVGTAIIGVTMTYALGYEKGYHRGKEHGVAEGTAKTYRWLNRGDDA